MKVSKLILSLLFAGASQLGSAASWHVSDYYQDPAEASLKEAFKAYENYDLKSMVKEVKKVLVNENASTMSRQHAISLWKKAMHKNARLPADWKLPETITSLKINVERRRVGDKVKYEMNLKGESTQADYIDQLQVIKFPNKVLIDKKNEIYREWEEEIWDGTPEFKGSSARQPEKFVQGLYLINIDTVDGKEIRGWFVLTDENSTDTPEVYRPNFDETLEGPNPVVSFEDFKSPEYGGFEYRGLWVGVTRLYDDSWVYLWGHYEGNPKRTSVKLGAVSENSLEKVSLLPGRYWLTVKYTEMKKFGDLKIGRASREAKEFKVK